MQCFYITKENQMVKGPVRIESFFEKENNPPFWLILSKDEFRHIGEQLGFTTTMAKNLLDMEQGVKVEVYAEYDLGILQRMGWQNEQYRPDSIHFFISKEKLLTVVETEYEWLIKLVEILQKETEVPYTLGYLFYRLLDQVIAEDKKYLEQMEKRTETLEEDVLNDVVQHFVKDMIQIRKQMMLYKRHYDPLIDIVEDLMSNENDICSKEEVRYFKILKNRMSRLMHLIDMIDDYTTHVREAYDAQIDIKLNRIMKYFTLITSLFLPLTLIVGWYGMNFTSMPEISWKYGYIYVIAISVASSIVCLYLFKKKKWL